MLASVERRILVNEFLLVFGHVVERMDRVRRAHRDARATIDASIRVNIHLRGLVECRLIFLGMDAVGRTNIRAQRIFDTGIGNYVCHDFL